MLLDGVQVLVVVGEGPAVEVIKFSGAQDGHHFLVKLLVFQKIINILEGKHLRVQDVLRGYELKNVLLCPFLQDV